MLDFVWPIKDASEVGQMCVAHFLESHGSRHAAHSAAAINEVDGVFVGQAKGNVAVLNVGKRYIDCARNVSCDKLVGATDVNDDDLGVASMRDLASAGEMFS